MLLTDQREKADVSVVGPRPLNALCSLLPVQMSTAVRPVDSLTGQSVRADTLEAAAPSEMGRQAVWWPWETGR